MVGQHWEGPPLSQVGKGKTPSQGSGRAAVLPLEFHAEYVSEGFTSGPQARLTMMQEPCKLKS